MIGGKGKLQTECPEGLLLALKSLKLWSPWYIAFSLLSHGWDTRIFVVLLILVAPAACNACSLAFKQISKQFSRYRTSLALQSRREIPVKKERKHTIICMYGFRGECEEVTFLCRIRDWPFLNMRLWMGWTRKVLFLRLLFSISFFLRGPGLNRSLHLGEEKSFPTGQMGRNQPENSHQLLHTNY